MSWVPSTQTNTFYLPVISLFSPPLPIFVFLKNSIPPSSTTFFCPLSVGSHAPITAYHWGAPGQEFKQKQRQEPWNTGLLLVSCLVCFPTQPRTTCPRLAPPTVGWAFPHQSVIKKMLQRAQANLTEANSQLKFPLPGWLQFVSIWQNPTSTFSFFSNLNDFTN